jgi:hypothetical protein
MVTSNANGRKNKSEATKEQCLEEHPRGAMTWAKRLKRVFNFDITICRYCQGAVKIIACIEERLVINKILAHINKQQNSKSLTAFLGYVHHLMPLCQLLKRLEKIHRGIGWIPCYSGFIKEHELRRKNEAEWVN